LLAVLTDEVPEVEEAYRWRAGTLRFMERPNVQEIIARCSQLGLEAPSDDTTYYLGRMRLMPTGRAPMMRWRKRLFALMARNASSVPDFFSIPPTGWWSSEHASNSDRSREKRGAGRGSSQTVIPPSLVQSGGPI
jgi:K+ potassium transporter C-terminal domain